MIGVVQQNDTGRPEIVYGRRCKPEDIPHEVAIAELEVLLKAEIVRGIEVGKAKPDGLLMIAGERCFLEYDHSRKMTRQQFQKKWTLYGKIEGFVLIVATSEGRMERLRKWSEAVKDVALFSTIVRLREGKGEEWVDWYGMATGLPAGMQRQE